MNEIIESYINSLTIILYILAVIIALMTIIFRIKSKDFITNKKLKFNIILAIGLFVLAHIIQFLLYKVF